nr:MurR/RpiR family transcriptional regulator [Lacticaseibacillus paracasei]
MREGSIVKLESLINQKYSNLNQTEKEILAFIIENRDFVRKASLSEVAEKSLFSKSAIFRCCKKIGLTGFSQLRYVLTDEKDSEQDSLISVDYLAQTVKSMLWTVNQFKSTNADDIYATLAAAGTIYIYSTGWQQQIMAQQLQRDLYLIGKFAFVFPTGHDEMQLSSTKIKPGDAVIVISYKGMNATIVQLVNNLKLNGVRIVSFTSFRQNRLAQAVNFNLYYDIINKTVGIERKTERFFANLTLLIDIFSMGFANYLVAKEERDHEHGEYGQRKSK